MDTDKLVKAIQIIVKEEIKVILPKLVKEGVKKEMAKLLKENKKLKEAVTPKQPTFMDSNVVEESVQPQKTFSKNPAINEVLAQTQPFNVQQRSGTDVPPYAGAPTEVSSGTMNFDSNSVHTLGASNIAQQMGYGQKPVQTGNTGMDKLLNKDYRQILKAVEKKKGPWRPGM
jgi:hypothetical protein